MVERFGFGLLISKKVDLCKLHFDILGIGLNRECLDQCSLRAPCIWFRERLLRLAKERTYLLQFDRSRAGRFSLLREWSIRKPLRISLLCRMKPRADRADNSPSVPTS